MTKNTIQLLFTNFALQYKDPKKGKKREKEGERDGQKKRKVEKKERKGILKEIKR